MPNYFQVKSTVNNTIFTNSLSFNQLNNKNCMWSGDDKMFYTWHRVEFQSRKETTSAAHPAPAVRKSLAIYYIMLEEYILRGYFT